MKLIRNTMLSLFIPALLFFFLTGCQKLTNDGRGSNTVEPPLQEENNKAAKTAEPKQQHKGKNESPNELEISSPAKEPRKDDLIDIKNTDGKQKEPSSSPKNKKDHPNYDVHEPYNASKPTLMGLNLHDQRDKVIEKFGQPSDEFTMEDAADPITVYEYPGFLIGFSKSNFVEFIEVSSDEINPGLNGLRLGKTIHDAIKALGKPDTNTEFVVSYRSEETILKLDVDPKTQIIHSIKLFGDHP